MTINNEVRNIFDLMVNDIDLDVRKRSYQIVNGTDGIIEENSKRSIIFESNFTRIIGKDASVLLAESSPLFV